MYINYKIILNKVKKTSINKCSLERIAAWIDHSMGYVNSLRSSVY